MIFKSIENHLDLQASLKLNILDKFLKLKSFKTPKNSFFVGHRKLTFLKKNEDNC